MARSSTLISIVGDTSASAIDRVVAVSANVSTVQHRDDDDPAEVWRRALGMPPVYGVVDVDPLEGIVEAWARRLEGQGDDLDVSIGLLGRPTLPDYYVVDTALPAPHRAWYLEFLHAAAPARVVPLELGPDTLLGALRSLPTGPALPPVDQLMAGARTFVPGTTGIAPDQTGRLMTPDDGPRLDR